MGKRKKKIEIIDIRLDIDLTEEIRKRTDMLNEEIKNQTKNLIERAKLRAQKTKSSKQREKELWDVKCQRVFDKLVAAAETDFPWLSSSEIMSLMNVESVSLQSVIQRLKSFIKKEGHWVLTRKRRSKESTYKLDRFG